MRAAHAHASQGAAEGRQGAGPSCMSLMRPALPPPLTAAACPPPPACPPCRARARSFLDGQVAYACGGSGSLFKSTDGGKSWKRDKATDNVAGNLYAIKFFGANGFILGNDGILLRYIGGAGSSGAGSA